MALSLLDSLPAVQERLSPPAVVPRPSYLLPRMEGSLRQSVRAHDDTPVFALAWLPTHDHSDSDKGAPFICETPFYRYLTHLFPSWQQGQQREESKCGGWSLAPCPGPSYSSRCTVLYRLIDEGESHYAYFQVTLSATRGLLVEPVAALQTASTHILCLHSHARAGAAASQSDVYLCAGTNMGTVYVWKLSTAQLTALAGTAGSADKSVLGPHCLHSHIQSSEDPIIHLSLSEAGGPSDERLALLASDNQSAVHLHLAPTRPGDSAPFFLAASQSFPSAVVGCGFRFAAPKSHSRRMQVGGAEEMEMEAAICLLQGVVVFRSPSQILGHRRIGPTGSQTTLLPQELLSMQSLSMDVLAQLGAGSESTAGLRFEKDRKSKSEVATAAAVTQPTERRSRLERSRNGMDGGSAGSGTADDWHRDRDLDEDVLPRAIVPSPARHWLSPSAPSSSPRPTAAAAVAPVRGREVRATLAADGETLPTDSEVRLAEHREGTLRHQQQMCDLTSLSPVAYHDSFFHSQNSYARPAFHSAKVRCHLNDTVPMKIPSYLLIPLPLPAAGESAGRPDRQSRFR